MPDISLSPIECSALLVLMAENRPLKESAELAKLHGVALKATHRRKLQELGLISTRPSPFTHELTPKGWRWITDVIDGSGHPKGQMNLGPLFTVARALRRGAAKSGESLEKLSVPEAAAPGSANGRKRSGADPAVAQTAWGDADRLLGYALQDIVRLERGFSELRAALGEAHQDALKYAEDTAGLVIQWVKQAASHRLVSLASRAGEEARFDPVEHEADDDLEEGAPVLVRKPPVVRGSGLARVIVVRGEVDALD